ncbi:MAG: carboxypeptidase-like regulatory domain-containing protein [Bacteroidota bacterium]
MKTWIWIILTLLGPLAPGQIIEGVVSDASTGEPIPYAIVQVDRQNLGTLANQLGKFTLRLPEDLPSDKLSIRIRALGYEEQTHLISTWPRGKLAKIALVPTPLTLSEVFIFATEMSPAEMIERAISLRQQNYLTQPHLMHSFYRHYCQENGTYGRLIEAAIDVYAPESYQQFRYVPMATMRAEVKQMRRSLDFTRLSAYGHSNLALWSAIGKDPLNFHGPLSQPKIRRRLSFQISDTTTWEGKPVLVIHADGPYLNWRYVADFYLSLTDWAIIKIDEQRVRRFKRGRPILETEHNLINFQYLNGKWALSHILQEGRRQERWLDAEGETWHSLTHDHHVEVLINSIEEIDKPPFRGQTFTKEVLAKAPYDPIFWESYPILAATPLEAQIERDLSARLELENQFNAQAGIEDGPAQAEQLTEVRLATIRSQYQGYPMLLIFWDASFEPSLKDAWRVRKTLRSVPEEPVAIVFISTDRDADTWQRAIRSRKLYLGEHLRLGYGLDSPIAKRHQVQALPYLVLQDRKGRTIWQGSDWPKPKELERVLEDWQE